MSIPNRILQIIKFFVSSSLFLSFNSVLLLYFSFCLYQIPPSPTILTASFLSTFAVYGLNKVTDTIEDSINKPHEKRNNRSRFLIPSIASYILSLLIGATEGPIVFAILLTPLFIGVIYSIKICKYMPRLKEVLGVKSLLVAFSWAFTGALLPAALSQVEPTKIILLFTYIFIQLLINTVIFDALDVKGDAISKVKTIPMALGRKKTKHALLAVNGVLLLWIGYCVAFGFFQSYLPALCFGVFYSYAIIWFFTSDRERKRFSAELLVDGEWVSMFIILRSIVR